MDIFPQWPPQHYYQVPWPLFTELYLWILVKLWNSLHCCYQMILWPFWTFCNSPSDMPLQIYVKFSSVSKNHKLSNGKPLVLLKSGGILLLSLIVKELGSGGSWWSFKSLVDCMWYVCTSILYEVSHLYFLLGQLIKLMRMSCSNRKYVITILGYQQINKFECE